MARKKGPGPFCDAAIPGMPADDATARNPVDEPATAAVRARFYGLRTCLLLELASLLSSAYRYANWQPPFGGDLAVSPNGRLVASAYHYAVPRSLPTKGYVDVRSLGTGERWMLIKETSRPTSVAFDTKANCSPWDIVTGQLHCGIWKQTGCGPPIAKRHFRSHSWHS